MSHFETLPERGYLNLKDKKIVVTGASSGIGRQTAITLSRYGARIALIARRKEQLEETKALLADEGHAVVCMDLSNIDEIEAGIKHLIDIFGAVDGLLYAAGVDISLPLQQFKPEKVQQMFSINYFGFLETIRQLCKKGRYNPGMRIVGMSSIAAKCGDKTHTVYSATKAAIDASVRCLAKELAPRGICINTIAPAMTNTAIFESFYERHGEAAKEELLKRQYLGIAEPEQIAEAIAFLLSEKSGFMTGSCMAFDGGFTAC